MLRLYRMLQLAQRQEMVMRLQHHLWHRHPHIHLLLQQIFYFREGQNLFLLYHFQKLILHLMLIKSIKKTVYIRYSLIFA